MKIKRKILFMATHALGAGVLRCEELYFSLFVSPDIKRSEKQKSLKHKCYAVFGGGDFWTQKVI